MNAEQVQAYMYIFVESLIKVYQPFLWYFLKNFQKYCETLVNLANKNLFVKNCTQVNFFNDIF